MQDQYSRECSIIAYYFSKFDEKALGVTGHKTCAEAFRELAALFAKKPNYIKLKRDEFDAIVSTRRKGWNKRTPAKDVWALHCELKNLSFKDLSALVKSIISKRQSETIIVPKKEKCETEPSNCSKMETSEVAQRNDIKTALDFIKVYFDNNLTQVKGNIYSSDGHLVMLSISKPYPNKKGIVNYWYGIYPSQRKSLEADTEAKVVFTFQGLKSFILVPYCVLSGYYPNLQKTQRKDGSFHYHIRFRRENNTWSFLTSKKAYDITNVESGFTVVSEDVKSEISEISRKRIKITSGNYREITVKSKK